MIDDATYDVVVVDAERDAISGTLRVELVVTTGAHKGELVHVRSTAVEGDPVGLLGLPATLVVEGGAPRLVIG